MIRQISISNLNSAETGKEIIPFVKEQLCYIPLDYDQELKRPEKDIARAFLLPDGKEIHLKQERFQSTEALFQPSIRSRNKNI